MPILAVRIEAPAGGREGSVAEDYRPAIYAERLRVEVSGERGRKILLDDVSLGIPSGHFVAVIGASGCGKSTLLKTLAGVQPVSQGRVFLAGHEVRRLREELPLAVGYLPQFGAFHSRLTVEEILRDAVALRLPPTVPQEVRQQWVRHITELARIESLLGQPYRTLSGGQMRRMALAEELIGDPAFLLLDELTSGLDVFSDQEMMLWLRELAHGMQKTIVLVTHATYHLQCCDSVVFLDQGRLIFHGAYPELLEAYDVASVTELFARCQKGNLEPVPPGHLPAETPPQPASLRTAPPPSGRWQFSTLLRRQLALFSRDRGQLWLQLTLVLTFPALVAVFATHGLPQVRHQTLELETNILRTLQERLLYLKESFQSASLISGLAMFQVILLTLMGANNGAREIAQEREILGKERRAGLSPGAYVTTKFLQIAALCLAQSFWMAWFVKTICGFPGSLWEQAGVLFATTLAVSSVCLGISAASPSAERASLLAIYLVGFQLPLSGAALALPEWLSNLCRPFIAAYWGWSGYLQTFSSTRYLDLVRQSRDTYIASYPLAMSILGLHILLGLGLAWHFVNARNSD